MLTNSFTFRVLFATFCAFFALAAPSRLAASGWTLTKSAQVGEGGLTEVVKAAASSNGLVVVNGTGKEGKGLYLMRSQVATPIVVVGTEMGVGLGRVESVLNNFYVDELGRVDFEATAKDGSTTRTGVFRAENGSFRALLPGSEFTHLLSERSPNGHWLVMRLFTQSGVGQTEISYTDGVTHTVVFTQPERVSSGPVRLQFAPAGNGTLAVLRQTSESTTDASGSVVSSKETSEMFTVGATARSIATTSLTASIDPDSGVLEDGGKRISYFVSDQAGSNILYVETTKVKSRTTSAAYFVNTLSGSTQIHSLDPRTSLFDALAVDGAGRVIGRFSDASSEFITGSVNGSSDRIVGPGDSLFGGTVSSISVADVPETPSTFGDQRLVLLEYRLSVSNVRGFCLASRGVTRWAAGVNGDWNVATSWTTQTVPVSNTEVLFDQDASYAVTVGTALAGRLSIQNGAIDFLQPNLSVTGLFGIGGDAALSQSAGAITAGELTIGVLPPVDVANEPKASLRLSNTGTTFTTSGPLEVGAAGIGELTVSGGAKLVSAAARIGAGSLAEVIVTGGSAVWESGPLAIGDRRGATLTVESGGSVVSTSAVIGRGDALRNEVAKVVLSNGQAVSTLPQLGSWFVNTDLTVADKLPGRLVVKEGSALAIGRNLQMSMTKQPADFPAAAGVVEINGQFTNASLPSEVLVFGDANLGVGADTLSVVDLIAGGSMFVSNDLSAGLGARSGVQISVGGRDSHGRRSKLESGTSTANRLLIGAGGSGFLQVTDGGLVVGRTVLIGGPSGSSGSVLVSGQNVEPSVLRASEHIVVGGSALFATADDAAGTLTVQNAGRVEAPSLAVFSKGVLEGNGTVVAASMVMEGSITPDIGDGTSSLVDGATANGKTSRQSRSAFSMPGSSDVASAIAGGNVLTLVGDVTLRDSARLSFKFKPGSTTPVATLAVNGKLTAGGTLVMEFTEGAAPRKGDVLKLITATTAAGSFRATEFRGLAPGFNVGVSVSASGAISVTALNDAVSSTGGATVVNDVVTTPPPVISTQPSSVKVRKGTQAVFEVQSTGVKFQWRRNGVPVNGATSSRFVIEPVSVSDAGDYDVIVSNAAGSVTSQKATLEVDAREGRLINLSVRAALAESQNLIVGSFMADGAKVCLLRAIGPGLDTFLTGANRNPTLALFDQNGDVLGQNDNWAPDLSAKMASVGAFALAPGSLDASLLTSLQGLRTVHVNGVGPGVVLVELYDADPEKSPRLINLSARSRVGTGGDVLIAGFVIDGPTPLPVLVRGIGPALSAFDVAGVLQDPVLSLYTQAGAEIATNDDWPADQATAHRAAGAFALTPGSKDAAVLVTLNPGVYTVHLRGKNESTGEGLIEVYDVRSP